MKHILVVDDNVEYLTLANKTLGGFYKITLVTSASQALEFMQTKLPDLILMDINMTEISGIEALKLFKSNTALCNIPVIILTSCSDNSVEAECLKLGAQDFITKPFFKPTMLHRINRILELDALRKSLEIEVYRKSRQVEEIKLQATEIMNASFKDPLTGVWNRNYTEKQANDYLTYSTNSAVLLMLDLDNFKSINDIYGHIQGDEVLIKFAAILLSHTRESDIVCRIGGDEFIVFLRGNLPISVVSEKARSIISSMRKILINYGVGVDISVSIGIACAREDGTDFLSLYQAADKALYYVKQNGKDGFRFFKDEKNMEVLREMTSSSSKDLSTLRALMSENESKNGVFNVDFNSFKDIYRLIQRIQERFSALVAQTLLFTLECRGDLAGEAFPLLKEAVQVSLRRGDVGTELSDSRYLVLLLNATFSDGGTIARRISETFNRLYENSDQVKLTFDIQEVSPENPE